MGGGGGGEVEVQASIRERIIVMIIDRVKTSDDLLADVRS